MRHTWAWAFEQRSPQNSAITKIKTRTTTDGLEVTSFREFLVHLATRTRNLCSHPVLKSPSVTFTVDASPTPRQQQSHDLVSGYEV